MDVRATLRGEMADRGWSVEDLRRRSAIKCSRVSLHRKLYGYSRPGDGKWVFQALDVEEVAVLLRPFKLRIEVG